MRVTIVTFAASFAADSTPTSVDDIINSLPDTGTADQFAPPQYTSEDSSWIKYVPKEYVGWVDGKQTGVNTTSFDNFIPESEQGMGFAAENATTEAEEHEPLPQWQNLLQKGSKPEDTKLDDSHAVQDILGAADGKQNEDWQSMLKDADTWKGIKEAADWKQYLPDSTPWSQYIPKANGGNSDDDSDSDFPDLPSGFVAEPNATEASKVAASEAKDEAATAEKATKAAEVTEQATKAKEEQKVAAPVQTAANEPAESEKVQQELGEQQQIFAATEELGNFSSWDEPVAAGLLNLDEVLTNNRTWNGIRDVAEWNKYVPNATSWEVYIPGVRGQPENASEKAISEFYTTPLGTVAFGAVPGALADNPCLCDGDGCQQSGCTAPLCSGGRCMQSGTKNATCEGGECSQDGTTFAACGGGGCTQVSSHNPSCDAGSCNQQNADQATCGGGGCNQQGCNGCTCSGGSCPGASPEVNLSAQETKQVEASKEEARKEEAPKEEAPKEEAAKETQEVVAPKEETTKEEQAQDAVPAAVAALPEILAATAQGAVAGLVANPCLCDGDGCSQTGCTAPVCSGGRCSQANTHNATCEGGECNQAGGFDISCDGGNCNQGGSTNAVCDAGSCDQTNAKDATCGGGACVQQGCTNCSCGGGSCPGNLASYAITALHSKTVALLAVCSGAFVTFFLTRRRSVANEDLKEPLVV